VHEADASAKASKKGSGNRGIITSYLSRASRNTMTCCSLAQCLNLRRIVKMIQLIKYGPDGVHSAPHSHAVEVASS